MNLVDIFTITIMNFLLDRLLISTLFSSSSEVGASVIAQLVKNLPEMKDIRWRRGRLHTPVFCPGEFHELYSPWDRKELDMTEQLSPHFSEIMPRSFILCTIFCAYFNVLGWLHFLI